MRNRPASSTSCRFLLNLRFHQRVLKQLLKLLRVDSEEFIAERRRGLAELDAAHIGDKQNSEK